MSIRKVLLQWMAVLLLLGGANSALARNLVGNPGFETLSPLVWTLTNVTRATSTCNGMTAASGSAFACANTGNVTKTVTQTISGGTVPIGMQLTFSFQYRKGNTTGNNPAIAWTIAGGATASGSVTATNTTRWTTKPQQLVTVTNANPIVITFTNSQNNRTFGLDNILLNTPTLEVKKTLVPAGDPGLFNLTIDSVVKVSNVGNSGTTGAVPVGTGVHTVGETAGTNTALSDYTTTYSCTNGTTTTTSATVTVATTAEDWVCTITNARKQGTLTVLKALSPTTDPGLFNLTIDGVVKVSNVGNGGTTGAVSVNTGTHTVGETAGTGTNLADYDTTYSCTNGTGSTATVVENQNTTCTITNTRKPPICRILSLKSTGTVTPPGSVLFGTAAYIATPSAGVYSIVLKTGAGEGNFTGNGLIYNDGHFPLLTGPPCSSATEQCFPYQSTFSTPTASVTDLTGLILGTAVGPGGTTITFNSSTTYTYRGGPFGTPHSGTYTATRDCATVPEPGTLLLMLLPLAGLRAAGRRRHAA